MLCLRERVKLRNAAMPSQMKSTSKMTCAITNGGSVCVGASDSKKGTFSSLNDGDEAVQIQRRRCRGHIDPAPCSSAMEDVKGADRDGEQHERERADGARRIEAERRNGKSGDAGQNRRGEKQPVQP